VRPFGRVLISAAALLAAAAAPADAGQFNADSFTLKNGLQVVVVPFHRAPAVTQMLRRVARRLLDPGALRIVVVGDPKSLPGAHEIEPAGG